MITSHNSSLLHARRARWRWKLVCGAERWGIHASISTSKRLLEDDDGRKGSRVSSRVSRHNRRSLEVSSAVFSSQTHANCRQQTNYKSRFAVFSAAENIAAVSIFAKKKEYGIKKRKSSSAHWSKWVRDHMNQYAHTEALLIRQSSSSPSFLCLIRRAASAEWKKKQWKNVYIQQHYLMGDIVI